MENLTTVIIADNSEEFAKDLTAALERTGLFRVVDAAADGQQAVAAVSAHRPDFLVLDLLLPELDGLGVLKALSGMESPPTTLATSRFITDFVASTAQSYGVGYLMHKPCEVSTVVSRLEELRTGQPCPRQDRQPDLEGMVTEIIHELGVPAHIKGYQYLREAIILAAEDMDVMNAVTTVLYPKVAEAFFTTAQRVKKAIRHAIEVAWDRGDLDTLQRYFGYTVSNTKGMPTNSEFIALIADRIQLQLRKQGG